MLGCSRRCAAGEFTTALSPLIRNPTNPTFLAQAVDSARINDGGFLFLPDTDPTF
jgi:hypothetical protein